MLSALPSDIPLRAHWSSGVSKTLKIHWDRSTVFRIRDRNRFRVRIRANLHFVPKVRVRIKASLHFVPKVRVRIKASLHCVSNVMVIIKVSLHFVPKVRVRIKASLHYIPKGTLNSKFLMNSRQLNIFHSLRSIILISVQKRKIHHSVNRLFGHNL